MLQTVSSIIFIIADESDYLKTYNHLQNANPNTPRSSVAIFICFGSLGGYILEFIVCLGVI